MVEQSGLYVRELVPSNDPILREVIPRFDFANPSIDPEELSHILAQTMMTHNGLGISANQVGIRARAFAMIGQQILVCFNPKIVDVGEESVLLEEGCLSYPDLYVKVKRPRVIKVRFTLPNGETQTRKFQDMTARVFQHELDHLDGVCHVDLASPVHKRQARTKLKKLQRQAKREAKEASNNG